MANPAAGGDHLCARANRGAISPVIAHIQNALALKPGAVVADIGTGDSPELLHISRAVGESGKVICVDISQKTLDTFGAS